MPSSEDIRYDRLCRTANSEAYLLSLQDEPLGRVELHFTSSVVYGLLIVEREMPEEEILDLIEQIDEDLVWSADLPRDDFVVTVYQGREVGVYSDPTLDDDDLEEEENGKGERI
jgi:hypothetical protein